VAQRNYGHRAIKLTWLYAFGVDPPSLDWSGPGTPLAYLGQPGRCSAGRPRRRCACQRCIEHFGAEHIGRLVAVERMGHREQLATPPAFRDLLIGIARGANRA
jgi:hypothetical protein